MSGNGEKIDAAWTLINRTSGRLGLMVLKRKIWKEELRHAKADIAEVLKLIEEVWDDDD